MIQLVKGFHDILPKDSGKWAHVFHTASKTLEKFGFREIVTPIMEKTELFQRGIGELTDIVEKEMYTFEDRGGETLSLRPEATAGILRSVVEHSLLQRDPVLKLFSIGPMFRRERPSKGRFRQFYQIDAEILGDDSPYTDAEAIAAAHAIMAGIGAKGLLIEINSLGCQECRPRFRALLKLYFEKYFSDLCPDCRRRLSTNPLRVLDCKVPSCNELAFGAPLISESLDEACEQHFTQVMEALTVAGIPFGVEPKMVRGLDYYSRTAFEIVHDELGQSKAVGGGGRYDTLVSELGGPQVSGIGFAIGVERLIMGMPEDASGFGVGVDFYVAVLGERCRPAAFSIIHRLRAARFSVESRNTPMSLKAQMKLADKLKAAKVVILGEDELERGEVTVRDMTGKQQSSVNIDVLVEHFQGVDV